MFFPTLLASYQKQFAYYRHLGEGAIAQLSTEEFFCDDTAGSNSVAVIVKHLAGNMKSRWTDFLTSDGEKTWRNRDAEFIADFADRTALETAWAEGWGALEQAINGLSPEQLNTIVYIRNEGHTVAEALNRQLAHYAYHVGQIVLLAKQFKGTEWQSLSIPKGQSQAFNQRKFAEGKGVRNFIDGLMGEGLRPESEG
ncbi:MAG: DinB family protein [Bacteroidota bacterium]